VRPDQPESQGEMRFYKYKSPWQNTPTVTCAPLTSGRSRIFVQSFRRRASLEKLIVTQQRNKGVIVGFELA